MLSSNRYLAKIARIKKKNELRPFVQNQIGQFYSVSLTTLLKVGVCFGRVFFIIVYAHGLCTM